MEIKIAILSDLHCHHSSKIPSETILFSDAKRLPASHHPVTALLELISNDNITTNITAMLGDITNKVDDQGISTGWTFIQEIHKALKSNILAPTIGNHDVISRNPKTDPFILPKSLYPAFPCQPGLDNETFWNHGYFFIEDDNIRILVINSNISHRDEDEAKHGFISPEEVAQIDIILKGKEKKPFQVALCHHHPMLHEDIGLGTDDIMTNGGRLLDVLSQNNFSFFAHGHKHHPKLSYHGIANIVPIFASGSFSASIKSGLASITRNLFHIVTLIYDERETKTKGFIKTWEYQYSRGWKPSTSNSADFPHIAGFGCFETPLSLAQSIEAKFNRLNQPFVEWEDFSVDFPDTKHLSPSAFSALAKHLKEKNIQFVPPAPDVPQIIGRESE